MSRVWKAVEINGKCELVRKVPKKKKIAIKKKDLKKIKDANTIKEAKRLYQMSLVNIQKSNEKDLEYLKALRRIAEQNYNKVTETVAKKELKPPPVPKRLNAEEKDLLKMAGQLGLIEREINRGIREEGVSPDVAEILAKEEIEKMFPEKKSIMKGSGKYKIGIRSFDYGDWNEGDTAKYGPLPEWTDPTVSVPSPEDLKSRWTREWKNYNDAFDKFKAKLPYIDLTDSFTKFLRRKDHNLLRGYYYLGGANAKQLKTYATEDPWKRYANPHLDKKFAEEMGKNIIKYYEGGNPFAAHYAIYGTGGSAYHDAKAEQKGKGGCVSKVAPANEESTSDEYDPNRRSFDHLMADSMFELKYEIANAARLGLSDKDVELREIAIEHLMDQRGKGTDELEGVDSDQLQQELKKYPKFKGVFSADKLPRVNTLPKEFGLILNLDNSGEPGSHWVAIHKDTDSIHYYDSFGDPPSEQTMKWFKILVQEEPKMLKLKINSIKSQDVDSDSCGPLATMFLTKMFEGATFKNATGFVEPTEDLSEKFEEEVKPIRKKFGLV